MDETTESRLDFLMKQYKQKLEQKEKDLVERQAEIVPSDFAKVREKIILPVMEEIGNKLKGYGHNYNISDQPHYSNIGQGWREKEENATMKVILADEKRPLAKYNMSRITFIAQKSGHNIEIYQYVLNSNGGRGRLIESTNTNQIDEDTVKKLILQFVEDVFEYA